MLYLLVDAMIAHARKQYAYRDMGDSELVESAVQYVVSFIDGSPADNITPFELPSAYVYSKTDVGHPGHPGHPGIW